ncbi:phosphoadenylyl-sulfate reductase [Alkalicoccobacillus gibsonii]|jgi:phosphoadenosine phosphosulfate reductase|uniref:Adenosine 5'-phosphosulfate reductase n=1 Tax=Alkalicoccobacillus gibsonii TaxID=79881 RepID=A0ABU9VH24_9BACI|nr:phosphoadenylyl-sulfate reductase [Alkalicoccobacillus gibsonii]MBM0064414.1 phosphoadenylyl-sulfate reductase [Alkalicoccobacillus gibsonii]
MSKLVLYENTDVEAFKQLNHSLARLDTLDILRWAFDMYGDELVYACSFGAESMVLIDLISKIQPNAHILFLDTDFHFLETYSLIKEVQAKYPDLRIELEKPGLTPEEQAEIHGEKLWETNPDLCCKIRKLDPLDSKLSQKAAWISGLRREQSPTRANTEYVNQDNRFKSVKVCPLIHWKEDEIWMYIKLHKLPYNSLHDHNYPSIGCTHCTKPVAEGEDSRSGRWSSTDKTECGLHQ